MRAHLYWGSGATTIHCATFFLLKKNKRKETYILQFEKVSSTDDGRTSISGFMH